jgi:MFS family permease
MQIFLNSVLLLYLTSLEMGRVGIMICLSLPALFATLLQVVFAHGADRFGKKKFGFAGISLMALSFLALLGTTFLPAGPARLAVVVVVAVFAVGACLQASGWFALILPMIPEPIRPGFFSRLRIGYQTVTLVCGLGCSALLEWRSSPGMFGSLFVAFGLALTIVLTLYTRLPEVEPPDPTLPPLRDALGKVIRTPAYLPFCAYAFLLALFTAGCPILFGMIEKSFLHLSDGTVVLLANLRLLGAIAGFFLGGWIVQKRGTKPMFLGCHFGFGVVLLLFLWRDAGGGPLVPILALTEAMFGLVMAASSVAFTVEMYALIPAENKSLSTSVFMTLQGAGAALGGVLPASAIRLGMFRESWHLAGAVRSDYDAQLLICATLVVVMVVTLGLVPAVTGRPQWISRE